ncbi:MAG: hypothetical protein PVSMB4_16960 [Ktedonobacterales bacterium]
MTDIILPEDAGENHATAHTPRLAHPHAVRAIFFDVGYTMLEPHPSTIDIVVRACAERGLAPDRACLEGQLAAAEGFLQRGATAEPQTWADERAILALWTGYFTELLRPCLGEGSTGARLDEIIGHVLRAFVHYTSYAPYPDVVPVLRLLHAHGLTLGVISDWDIGLGPILHEHGLNQYFDFAVISAAVRHAKPHPQLFELALKRANAIPDYAVHVGDSYVLDVLGARSVGIAPVMIDRRGKVDPATVDVPVVRDLYGLLDILELEREGVEPLVGY